MWFPCGGNSYVLEDGRRLRSGDRRAVAYYSTEREVGGYSGKRWLMEDPPPWLHQTDTFGTNISIDAMTKLKMESYVREARALS